MPCQYEPPSDTVPAMKNPYILLSNIAKRTRVSDSGCHIWTGSKTGHGYARIHFNKIHILVSRWIWELYNNESFPEGMEACHSCDTPACVNPLHIWAGTHRQNMQDAHRKKRITWRPPTSGYKEKKYCVNGHSLSGNGVIFCKSRGRKFRSCRICRNAVVRTQKARLKSKLLLIQATE